MPKYITLFLLWAVQKHKLGRPDSFPFLLVVKFYASLCVSFLDCLMDILTNPFNSEGLHDEPNGAMGGSILVTMKSLIQIYEDH